MKKGSVLFDKSETIEVEFPFTVTKEIITKLIKKNEDGIGAVWKNMYMQSTNCKSFQYLNYNLIIESSKKSFFIYIML